MSGTLFVVATPIGNLSDLSDRVRDVLRQVDVILCEDTRQTKKLLSHLEISKKDLYRFDAHEERKRIKVAIERLQGGEDIALVSDAGTPGVSDPGEELVKAAHLENIRVTPIPGPSALASIVSVSGFVGTKVSFEGFFPRKLSDQKKALDELRQLKGRRLVVWYESPKRVVNTLAFLSEWASEREITLAKELTKRFERIWFGKISNVFKALKTDPDEKIDQGEWCLALHWEGVDEKGEEWAQALRCLMACGISASMASKKVVEFYDVSKKEAYALAVSLKEIEL